MWGAAIASSKQRPRLLNNLQCTGQHPHKALLPTMSYDPKGTSNFDVMMSPLGVLPLKTQWLKTLFAHSPLSKLPHAPHT